MTQSIPGTRLLDPGVIQDPYPFYRQLQIDAPVWQVPDREVVVVSSMAPLAEAAGRTEDFSSNMRALLYRDEEGLPARLSFGDVGVDALATADPPDHKVHRSVVFSELVEKRMATLEPEIADIARRTVGQAVEAGEVDFMAAIGNVVPITVISRLIGFPDSDPDLLLQAAFDSTSMIGGTLPLDRLEALVARTGEIETWIADQLARVAEAPDDDILGAIARGVDDQVLSVAAGTIILHTLLSAGGESTTSLLGNGVRLLAENPDLQDELRRNPHLVPAFIEEALRLESPFRFLMRYVPDDTELAGVDIPGGVTMLLMWGAANRDPAAFEDPDDAVLDRRAPRRHVAFGRGIHHCVGAPLARLEARIVLTELLARTSRFSLGLDQPPVWVNSLMVRRHQHLPVRLLSR
jgi:cytochrome P450